MISIRGAVLVFSLVGVIALEHTAWAQEVELAEGFFNKGIKEMKSGDYPAGCPAIAESLRLDPQPGTLFTLAVCEERWGHSATAIQRYSEYLLVYDRLSDERKAKQSERYKVATAQRETLAPDVPELLLLLAPGAPPGTVVTRDGQVVASAALGIGLPVDPGEHVITVTVPGGGIREQRITLLKGEKKKISLDVQLAPAPARASAHSASAVEPPRPSGPSRRRIVAYAAGGLGVAGLAFGAVTGGLMLSRKSVVSTQCNEAGLCSHEGSEAGNSARTLANMSTAGWAVALAGVGTAAVLYFTESPPARASAGAPVPTARSRALRLSASVAPTGTSGGVLEIRGTW